jgi:hypothetical protein
LLLAAGLLCSVHAVFPGAETADYLQQIGAKAISPPPSSSYSVAKTSDKGRMSLTVTRGDLSSAIDRTVSEAQFGAMAADTADTNKGAQSFAREVLALKVRHID